MYALSHFVSTTMYHVYLLLFIICWCQCRCSGRTTASDEESCGWVLVNLLWMINHRTDMHETHLLIEIVYYLQRRIIMHCINWLPGSKMLCTTYWTFHILLSHRNTFSMYFSLLSPTPTETEASSGWACLKECYIVSLLTEDIFLFMRPRSNSGTNRAQPPAQPSQVRLSSTPQSR